MTPKNQIRVNVDRQIQHALEQIKSDALIRLSNMPGSKNPNSYDFTLGRLILSRLVKINDNGGIKQILMTKDLMPLIFSPPSGATPSSVRFAIRITDNDLLNDMIDVSKQTNRPVAHVLYTLIRHLALVENAISPVAGIAG